MISEQTYNMIQQQVRPMTVLDERVLEAMTNVNRQPFFSESYQHLVCAETRLPLNEEVGEERNDYSLTPGMIGQIMQSVMIDAGDTILEIGTGSGYVGACMASLGKKVDSIDVVEGYVTKAREACRLLEIKNITHTCIDISEMKVRTYDVIVATGSVEQNSAYLQQFMAKDARLFAICGEYSQPTMEAMLFTKTAPNVIHQDFLFNARIEPLQGFISPPKIG